MNRKTEQILFDAFILALTIGCLLHLYGQFNWSMDVDGPHWIVGTSF